MKITRIWAMPNKWTFRIKPIKELIAKYVGSGGGWLDPFAGENSPAEFKNDINPDREVAYHLHALDFIKLFDDHKHEGVLFDPPYSLRQVKECYDNIGIKMSFEDSKRFPNSVKEIAATKIKTGGYAISFGWNSGGFGIKRGFKIVEILLVPHGGHHNDTIVTVEQKVNNNLDTYIPDSF